MKLILEMSDEQEEFVVNALTMAATTAWRAAMSADMDPEPCPEHPDGECANFWRTELDSAEAVLAQFPSGVLKAWRESLAEVDDDEEGDR